MYEKAQEEKDGEVSEVKEAAECAKQTGTGAGLGFTKAI